MNGYWVLLNVDTMEEALMSLLDRKQFETFDDVYKELCTYGVPVLVDEENSLYRINKVYYMIDYFSE